MHCFTFIIWVFKSQKVGIKIMAAEHSLTTLVTLLWHLNISKPWCSCNIYVLFFWALFSRNCTKHAEHWYHEFQEAHSCIGRVAPYMLRIDYF